MIYRLHRSTATRRGGVVSKLGISLFRMLNHPLQHDVDVDELLATHRVVSHLSGLGQLFELKHGHQLLDRHCCGQVVLVGQEQKRNAVEGATAQ
jgi:hypothetical protein